MLFNSVEFAIFLPLIFAAHWLFCKNAGSKNTLLLVASYFFYGCWDWRFTFLLMFSTALDYYTGQAIHNGQTNRMRKIWLCISITINLGFLAFFKYYNFFLENLETAGAITGFSALKIILPVGISFYTFHGMSYVIDIYNRRTIPEQNPITYALFVSFFPLLVAGPIERATHLLPQLRINRNFTYSKGVLALRQILWGLFKKVVVADSCASIVNPIFQNVDSHSGSTLAIGAVLFAFQIYGDFSGYSDIALGSARLFGIELLRNFAYPYFSRDIAEFWRRWHISLSSWFKDYVYIPLGGSQGTTLNRVKNTLIIFLLSGFWHGANWTFITWGALNAIYFIPSLIRRTNRNNITIVASESSLPTPRETVQIFTTFMLTDIAWIFFRANSVTEGVSIIKKIFSSEILTSPSEIQLHILLPTLLFIAFLIVIEWLGRKSNFAIQTRMPDAAPLRYAFYTMLSILILLYYGANQEFIYFQF
jgi:alginate O-acetyltransferase complex protein AlgI